MIVVRARRPGRWPARARSRGSAVLSQLRYLTEVSPGLTWYLTEFKKRTSRENFKRELQKRILKENFTENFKENFKENLKENFKEKHGWLSCSIIFTRPCQRRLRLQRRPALDETPLSASQCSRRVSPMADAGKNAQPKARGVLRGPAELFISLPMVHWVANKRFEISKFKFNISESSNLRTSQGSFSAVSKPNFASKYSFTERVFDWNSSSLKSLFATQVHRRGGVIARRSRGTQVDWPDWPERLDSCTSLLDPCTPRKRMESEAMFAEFQFSTIIEII